MAAGTLSVTNNSKAVEGVDTTFTAFKAGDFLTLVVGQVPYTVAIASIESATALTLVLPFDGPTATGLAWDGVKRDTMSLATMGVTVQAQKALRLMIADENNWRAIFGDAEEITVSLPNGQVMQGMSWGYLSQLMKQIDPSKFLAKSNNLSDVDDPAAARGHLGIGPTDNVTVNRLVTNARIQAGRATWDGNSWGTAEVRASLLMLMPDGVSPPGMYVMPLGTEGGYPTQFVYNFDASDWRTPSQVTAQNFTATKTNMGYSQLWSGALFRGPAWLADNGVENYQSLVGGAVGTSGYGFSSGVAFGMMTTGGASWPTAQISVGTMDRDAAGNIDRQTQFRFSFRGTISYSAGSEGSGSFQQVPASDRNLKHDIADDTSSTAYDNIKAMRFRTFVFNNDEQERQRRGVIAQELEEIDPLYVKHRIYHNEELNGPLVHQLELDTAPLLLDTMRALQDTIKQVEDLKAEIAALKQAEDLKK
ncbi:putative tail fiber [Escherichia phage jat]|uniref:Putative tail fiber n=1 Tax=Escherichia phage jat TaxID=2696411 RepID=A0A6B9XI64_9CAUD|nr:putative tail fiber [Escherichia phage jat]QHR76420.1 putative tail fiber [Escherichia phage jat]